MRPEPRRRAALPIPVARPRLPPASAVLPYLRRMDRAAWYSNHGPLAGELTERLAAHWGLAAPHVTLLCNATAAITLALLASGAPPGSTCLLPSWTFAASAGAVCQASLQPRFIDVDPATGALDPAHVRALVARRRPGAVLVVSPFGAPLDLPAWDALHHDTGIPVVIDAAAAFDTLRHGGPMPPGDCPLAVSLHATKVFGVGEGGALLCRNPAIMERVRRLAQFGFLGTREATLPGFNAKLSEYAAAVGLAGLDNWPETRTRWHVAASRYRRALPEGLRLPPDFGASWIASTLSVLLPPGTHSPETPLRAAGIETLRWWGPGCHAQPAYADRAAEPLLITEDLASRTLGLPFWQDLDEGAVTRVGQALAAALAPSRPLVAA